MVSYVGQQDFSAGIQRDVAPHLIDPRGTVDIINGLVDDDGSIYRRGGTANKASGTFDGLPHRFIWDGYLRPGQRTVFASTGQWGVLASNDTSTVGSATGGLTTPAPAAELKGYLFLPGGAMYGGSRQSSPDYTTGTVTATNGSTTVTGAGTTWSAGYDAGMLFRVNGERAYVIASRDSNTQLTLAEPYVGATGAGKSYRLSPLLATPGSPYQSSTHYAVCCKRLIAFSGRTVYFSGLNDPHTWTTATDFHELPEGVNVLGVFTLGQTLLIFTTGGVWSLRGLAYAIVDAAGNPQHRLEKLTGELILLGAAGVATWQNRLVVPTTDGVYLIGENSAPEPIGRPIESLIRDYASSAYRPGGAVVYRGHYVLPILASDGTPTDTLVCRLDRPVRSRGLTTFPWTRMDGAGGRLAAYAVRALTGAPDPLLLGVSTRVLDASGYFEPSATLKSDADGTHHVLELVTRAYTLFGGRLSTVKRFRLRYELIDAGADNPTLSASLSDGSAQAASASGVWGANWGTMIWADPNATSWLSVQGAAPESDGTTPYTWHVVEGGRMRYALVRVRSSGPSAKLALRSIELAKRDPRTLRA